MWNRLFLALSYGGRSSQNVLAERGTAFSQVETSKAQQHSSLIPHKNLFYARHACAKEA